MCSTLFVSINTASRRPTGSILKMPILQDVFRDQWWIDISYQLLCFGLLDASHFDGPLLRKDIPNGIWLGNQLVCSAGKAPFFTSLGNANDGSF